MEPNKLWCNGVVAPPDDEIPDLLPDDPVWASRSPTPRAGSVAKPELRPESVRPASQRPSTPRSEQPPLTALRPVSVPSISSVSEPDSEPRPSRPIPGRDSGLELEIIEEPESGGSSTSNVAVDELEFDPTSIPPPPLGDSQARTPERPASSRGGGGVQTLVGGGAAREEGASRRSHSPSSRPPRADVSSCSAVSVPSLDIPSLTPARAHAKPTPTSQPAFVPPPAVHQGAAGVDFSAFPGMGNEVDLGEGLDDLDFGGAAAAQLNVSVPVREPDDDVPWPTCRTPEGAELAVNHAEAEELSGFGRAPESFLQTPLYALRVFRALESLRTAIADAEKRLRDAEDRRDERLAALALDKRAELEGKDRFSSLFAQIERHDESIALKKRQLEMADVDGAQALRDVQAQIDTLNAERIGKERIRDERRIVLDESARTVRRFRAALQRVQIEWRNVEARAAKVPGKEMPDHLDAQLDALEQQRTQIQRDLNHANGQYKELKRSFDVTDDQVRVAVAEVQRAEGQKEGLLIAYEGEIGERARALDDALFEKQRQLAKAARAIVDLRGEVPVPAAVRRRLLAADREVSEAARRLATLRLALGSMDPEAYGTGRAVWIGGAVVVFLFLAFLAL